ncbi:methyltransferase domain-containing protein [Coraliomargarita sp. SDUM461004]|uniref:Methyltransferase domain-containing protein n=1 Tax=Thalassobacterium sedimentorum TaxID=3041258 RepID=A0ABU1ADT3_9BACT|nr:methyltransferase [Coraliomargarita sp. SDUM461004]MDQ8192793.1 methyltransferase domain-containing protein [Coraliomargarita sp. SDUM461004]
MKQSNNLAKEVYKQLRKESWEVLWEREVPRFDAGNAETRLARVGLVRAIGVVALEKGTQQQKRQTREWLARLLTDQEEKVRRYAMNALPKIGGSVEVEKAVLDLLDKPEGTREVEQLSHTLSKIGGQATLQKLESLSDGHEVLHAVEQKVKAQLAREEAPARIRLTAKIKATRQLRIHLRSRRGMELFVREELQRHARLNGRFKIVRTSPGCVALSALHPFTLQDLYELRTLGSIHFVLGVVAKNEAKQTQALAKIIASERTQLLCRKLTQGQPRYRLQFMRVKVSARKVQSIVNEAFLQCPDLLNDPRQSPWAIEIYPEKVGLSVELRPRVLPDPRFTYRKDDVPASTHPPLAAAMAQLAGVQANDVVWDPFCGSGLELIERARLGGVASILATDIDENAIEAARLNFASAGLSNDIVELRRGDFRNYEKITGIASGSISLIIANPPLGRRVRTEDLKGLILELYHIAAKTLCPGGRLVFINPLKIDSPVSSLKLKARHVVDLGGFDCRVEKWVLAS